MCRLFDSFTAFCAASMLVLLPLPRAAAGDSRDSISGESRRISRQGRQVGKSSSQGRQVSKKGDQEYRRSTF